MFDEQAPTVLECEERESVLDDAEILEIDGTRHEESLLAPRPRRHAGEEEVL